MKTHLQRKSKNAPLFIVGGVVLVLAVTFLVITQFLMTDARKNQPGASSDHTQPMHSYTTFRNDGHLKFLPHGSNPSVEISIEIASTDEARTQGLMGRMNMREDQGMLFLFENEEERAFWMANTPLSLDIIFVNARKRIVKIHEATTPYSEQSLPSGSAAQFVVEVNANFCNRHGIVEGDLIDWIANP